MTQPPPKTVPLPLTQKISILMPAYNEAAVITPSVNETISTLDEFGWDYEVVVIDDGSMDDTLDQLDILAKRHGRMLVVRNRENFGKGRALKKGFRSTQGDLVAFLDCDMDLHPDQVKTLYEIMQREKADVVIGSKFHPESRVDYPWHRRIISTTYFFFVKMLFGLPIRDTQTGLKLFKREVLSRVFPRMLVKRYAYDLELLALAHHWGYRIVQAPITLETKRYQNRIRPIDILHTFWDTLAVWYRMHVLRWYDRKTVEQ
ncbi:MAG: glycosyltransferase family 2 protein [Candidatus Omnitrophica bacterium]|nr:glycosyltransferase family 2 protein [Candidatus Omnitrophota bacterium]